jgi:hypothetical protein
MPDGSVRLYQELLSGLDYRVVYRAGLEWVKLEKWFPSVAELREYARKVRREVEAEEWSAKAIARKESAPADVGVPEWVQVWWWHKNRTLTSRQAANTTAQGPVEERNPVRVREFPQLPQPLTPDAYTVEEYEEVRRGWVDAGSPRVGAVEILAGA